MQNSRREGPRNSLESSYFCYLGAHEIFLNPTTIPSGVKGRRVTTTTRGKIPLSPMGVLAPIPAHAGHSAQPPLTLAEIFGHACLQSQFHQISPFSGQNRVNWGCTGDSQNIFYFGFLIFLLLRSPCKISKL